MNGTNVVQGGTEAKSVIDASPPGTFLQYQDVTYE